MLPEGALKPTVPAALRRAKRVSEGGGSAGLKPGDVLGERSESLRGEAPAAYAAGGGAEPQ